LLLAYQIIFAVLIGGFCLVVVVGIIGLVAVCLADLVRDTTAAWRDEP
jgi:hypothetical protein